MWHHDSAFRETWHLKSPSLNDMWMVFHNMYCRQGNLAQKCLTLFLRLPQSQEGIFCEMLAYVP